MKKIITLAIAAFVTTSVVADFAVDLKNNGSTFTTDGSAFVDQAIVQLVWNASAPSDAVDTTLTNVGTVLNSITTTSGYAGTFSDQNPGVQTYTESNTGYLTVRVFDAANVAVGDKYFEFNIDVDGSLTEYVSTTPDTIYDTDAIAGGNFQAAAQTIIPEPATIGLLGIAGAGLFAARRKTRV